MFVLVEIDCNEQNVDMKVHKNSVDEIGYSALTFFWMAKKGLRVQRMAFICQSSVCDGLLLVLVLNNWQTHLPLTFLSEDLSLSYVRSVPSYSQLQLPLPGLDSQWLAGPRSWELIFYIIFFFYTYNQVCLHQINRLTAAELNLSINHFTIYL